MKKEEIQVLMQQLNDGKISSDNMYALMHEKKGDPAAMASIMSVLSQHLQAGNLDANVGCCVTKGFEEKRCDCYLDSLGIPTVGYGHNLQANGPAEWENASAKAKPYSIPAFPAYKDVLEKAGTRENIMTERQIDVLFAHDYNTRYNHLIQEIGTVVYNQQGHPPIPGLEEKAKTRAVEDAGQKIWEKLSKEEQAVLLDGNANPANARSALTKAVSLIFQSENTRNAVLHPNSEKKPWANHLINTTKAKIEATPGDRQNAIIQVLGETQLNQSKEHAAAMIKNAKRSLIEDEEVRLGSAEMKKFHMNEQIGIMDVYFNSTKIANANTHFLKEMVAFADGRADKKQDVTQHLQNAMYELTQNTGGDKKRFKAVAQLINTDAEGKALVDLGALKKPDYNQKVLSNQKTKTEKKTVGLDTSETRTGTLADAVESFRSSVLNTDAGHRAKLPGKQYPDGRGSEIS